MVKPKRKTKRKKKQTVAKLARQVKAIASRTEQKYIQVASQTTKRADQPAGAVTGVLLNGVTQGTTANTRIGNMIKMNNLRMRAYFTHDGTTPVDVIVRLIFVIWKDNDNGNRSLDLLFQDPTSVLSLYHMEHAKANRFKILYDTTFTMRPNDEEDNQNFMPVKFSFKPKYKVNYNGNAGTYADIERNALYMFVLGTSTTANNPSMVYEYRLTYYDE